jgi:hypothetical protein
LLRLPQYDPTQPVRLLEAFGACDEMRVTSVVGFRVETTADVIIGVLVAVGTVALIEGMGTARDVAGAADTGAETGLATGALPLPETYRGGPGSG